MWRNKLKYSKKKNISESFEIDPYKKTCMLNGFDDIDFAQYEDRLIGTRKEIVFNVIWKLAQSGDKWAIELLERLGCLD